MGIDEELIADIEVSVAHAPWRGAMADVETRLRAAIAHALARGGLSDPRAVGVLLGDDQTVRALNRNFRGKDAPTNVLSFPAVPLDVPHAPLGDIALAFETVRAEAERARKPFADHALHLAVHGALHLLGLTHEDDASAAEMESAERSILAELGIPDPYAGGERAA